MHKSFGISLLFLIIGCSLPFRDERTQEVFSLGGSMAIPQAMTEQPVPAFLIVDDPLTSPLYDSRHIVFKKGEIERGFYQYAQWDESVSKRLSSLLLRYLDGAKVFKAVGRRTGVGDGDFLLSSELLSFDHNIEGNPGVANISLRVELSDLRRRKLCGTNIFNVTTSATRFSARGAAEALSQGSAELFKQISEWAPETAKLCRHD